MADTEKQQSRPTSLGIYDKPQSGGITGIEVAAAILSALWLLGAGGFFLIGGGSSENSVDTTGFVVTMLAIFMPVAMIWVAATAMRTSRVMREESRRLQAAIDAMRQTYIAQQQGRGRDTEPSMARKLDEIAAVTRKTESALSTLHNRREADQSRQPRSEEPKAQNAREDQPALALGTTAEDMAPPLAKSDFIRALNFPETAEDKEGFAALRKAMKDRQAAQLIQAAQDILTLLSQDGIYMDDLRPDRCRPEVWRAFASGARGRAVAALGGVRDRSSLALTAGRMKQDPIFRDAAHHFLRRFDRAVSDFAENATDADIVLLSDTRTARAFMLLGRVAGTFD